ncbi:MAG: efflux RND transporter periplasmic adaptor subunit [Myxococcota bacterium]|nr:efflux RND transporter periplasmic adaptor subunit [Myxococcota bacterium]MDW8360778.1 efflux RND transporter periplasmic adaptor subunit [Myxococcales bacterium]
MKGLRTASRLLLPVLVVAAGVGVHRALVATAPHVERREGRASPGVPVEIWRAEVGSYDVAVEASGTVVAARQVVVQPELQARVVWQNPRLVPGAVVRAGEPLVRLDARDVRTQLVVHSAQLEQSRLTAETERSRRLVAERELARLGEGFSATPEGRALALREPHLRAAEAQIRAAEAGIQQARTTLSRTLLVAPFDALVLERNVDVGQLVGPTSRLATLVGTEHYWVQVSVPVDQLGAIAIPGIGGQTEGAPAHVVHRSGSVRVERTGRVLRLLGSLDPAGRMARLLVEIDDPLGLRRSDGGLPLLLGAFVHVRIAAGRLESVVRVPRAFVHDDDTVRRVGPGDRLEQVRLDVVWRDADAVYARAGLRAGDRVVASPLSDVAPGMPLRVVGEVTSSGARSTSGPVQSEAVRTPPGSAS